MIINIENYDCYIDWYKNIQIRDSYKMTSRSQQIRVIKILYDRYKWFRIRSVKSYVRELRTHNRLYKLGLFKSRTKDCDLNPDESILRRIGYFFLGF